MPVTPHVFIDTNVFAQNNHNTLRLSFRDSPNYKFARATVEPGKLSFTTSAVRDVSYRFEDRFTRGGDLAKDAARRGEDVVEGVLEGTVTKLSDGREVGGAGLKFDLLLGG